MDEKQGRKRARVGRAEWAKRVAQWCNSGLTSAEFASRLGIHARTLKHWKWILGRESREKRTLVKARAPVSKRGKPGKAATSFAAELIEVRSAPHDSRFEIELRNGRRLRFPEGYESQGLSRLLEMLEAQ